MPYAGKVQKLSGKGWALNWRYLIKDENGLAYYSKLPDNTIIEGMAHPPKAKPKVTVQISHATLLTEADRKKYAKKLKFELSFKIIFRESAITKKKTNKEDNSKNVEWYIQVETENELQAWLANINETSHTPTEEIKSESSPNPNVEKIFQKEPEQNITAKIESTANNKEDGKTSEIKEEIKSAVPDNTTKEDKKEEQKGKANTEEHTSNHTSAYQTITDIQANDKIVPTQPLANTNIEQAKPNTILEENKESIIKKELLVPVYPPNLRNTTDTTFNPKSNTIKAPTKIQSKTLPLNSEMLNKLDMDGTNIDWNIKFQSLWDDILASHKQFEECVKRSEQFMEFIGQFRKKAEFNAELLINKMIYIPAKYESQVVVDNIIFEIASPENSTSLKGKSISKKDLQRKFRSMDILFDTLYALSKPDSKIKLRVPLCCYINFKGYYVLATSVVPHTEIMPNLIENNPNGNELKDCFKGIQELLNIESDIMQLCPTMSIWQSSQHSISNIYYLINAGEIFPFDQQSIMNCCLREEFVSKYKIPLPCNENESKCLEEAYSCLESQAIPSLVYHLECMPSLPVESQLLCEIIHSYGVNMKYLGKIHEHSNMADLQNILLIEMLSRRFKEVFYSIVLNSFNKQQAMLQSENITADPSPSKLIQNDKLLIAEKDKVLYNQLINSTSHKCFMQIAIDTINDILLLKNEESWKELISSTAQYYMVAPEIFININHNAFIFAVLHHLGIYIAFGDAQNPGSSIPAFKIDDIASYNPCTKLYGLRTIVYTTLAERYAEFRMKGKNTLSLKSLTMKMKIAKNLFDIVDIDVLAETAEIILEEHMAKEAIEKAEEALNYLNPLHASTVRIYCILIKAYYSHYKDKTSQNMGYDYFFKACKAIDFHLGKNHPLHSDVYRIMGKINMNIYQNYPQAEYLYKSSKSCCKKTYGVEHPRTADIYADMSKLYYKEGKMNEALKYAEKAYKIYEKESMLQSQGALACQLAHIYEVSNEIDTALKYSTLSSNIYHSIGNTVVEYRQALYNTISIAFTGKKDEIVIRDITALFESCQSYKEINENIRLQSILVLLIATIRSSAIEQKEWIVSMIESLYRVITVINPVKLSYHMEEIEINSEAKVMIMGILSNAEKHKEGICDYASYLLLCSHRVHFTDESHRASIETDSFVQYEQLKGLLRCLKEEDLIDMLTRD